MTDYQFLQIIQELQRISSSLKQLTEGKISMALTAEQLKKFREKESLKRAQERLS